MHMTTVRLERPEGTPLQTGIAVQIEAASAQDAERLDLQGARTYDVFWIYTLEGVPDVPLRRRDLLVDERENDPETGLPARYRVTGLVETFAGDHQEALCERIIGG